MEEEEPKLEYCSHCLHCRAPEGGKTGLSVYTMSCIILLFGNSSAKNNDQVQSSKRITNVTVYYTSPQVQCVLFFAKKDCKNTLSIYLFSVVSQKTGDLAKMAL